MAWLHHTLISLFVVLPLVLMVNGEWSESESEENETAAGQSTEVCPGLERMFQKLCLGDPDRRYCRQLQRRLKRRGCTPACSTSTSACGEVEQSCQADCAEGNAVPGLCAPNQQCCLADADSGLDECPTGDAGVTCEAADTCTGSGGTLDSDFACAAEGDMCCRRTCPESEPGVMCAASATCTGSGGTANNRFSCSTDGEVCCEMTCPTTEDGVSCESAATCTGSGATQDTGLSCPSEGQVCCRRSCPEAAGLVMCEQPRCSDGFFVMPGFPCPNEGDLCCELGLGRR